MLGGHKLPFTGLPKRMEQLIDNHHGALRFKLIVNVRLGSQIGIITFLDILQPRFCPGILDSL